MVKNAYTLHGAEVDMASAPTQVNHGGLAVEWSRDWGRSTALYIDLSRAVLE